MADLVWYLAANILPVEQEYVLVYDAEAHYMANCIGGQWYDHADGGTLVFSPEARWTDLPRP
jgi:hypothetical protein